MNGVLANNGTIRKVQNIPGTGSYTFGLAGGPVNGANLSINVTSDSFTNIQVDRLDQDHPNHTGTAGGSGVGWGRYWKITPSGSGTVNLTLPHNVSPDTNAKVCKYPGGLGGFGWDCGRTSSTANTVARNGIASLSDWAAGNNVGPRAVELSSLKAHLPDKSLYAWMVITGLILIGGVGLILARRVRRQAR